MEIPTENESHAAGAMKRIMQRVLVIVENRFQLLLVEVQEERERALMAIWMALGAAVFGLLACIAFTIMITVILWNHSPLLALLIPALLYTTIAIIFYRRLTHLQRDWQTLPGTLDQIKKDRECLEKIFN